jgi:hypothetical protein
MAAAAKSAARERIFNITIGCPTPKAATIQTRTYNPYALTATRSNRGRGMGLSGI